MKYRRPAARLFLLATFLFIGALTVSLQAKPIHLRSQVVHPRQRESIEERGAAAQSGTHAHGLYLVQFKASPTETQQAVLAALGADLITFIPEDTFLARFKNVSLAEVRALPFLEWIGEYRPEYKIHGSLRTKPTGTTPGKSKVAPPAQNDKELDVTVILAPRITGQELSEEKKSFARIRQESHSRIGHILKGSLHPNRLEALSRSSVVLWIEPFRDMKLVDEISSKIVAGDGGAQRLLMQLYGFDGSGVTVAVADSGLHNGDAETMHPDLLGRTPAFFHYGSLLDAADEHSHGTHVAGIVAGNGSLGETDENGFLYGLGVAPGARIVGQRLFDAAGGYQPPPSFEVMTHDAARSGAEIGSNSWGDDTQGVYDVSAMEFDELVRDADFDAPGNQEYILEFSAGNAGPGPQTIGSPAVAKNVIATGAAQNDRPDLYIYDAGPDAMADFSSRGPAADGRIKPDIVAPGTWIASLQSGSATDQYAWAGISPNYQYQGGTSQAGPHASGAAAVFVQWYRSTITNRTPSPALVKAALINTAVDMDDSVETGPAPNMDEGWGRLDLTPLLDPDQSFIWLDQTVLLTNSQLFETNILIAGSEYPLKLTLAYTDVPGFPGSGRVLVNDLDLELVDPEGVVYRGNRFLDGESIPNPVESDKINNVEGVLLWSPSPGEYRVRVRATQIVSDARLDQPGVNQDFALVISGRVPDPRAGTILLNRSAYRVPDQIRLTLFDSDLAGLNARSVLLRSATEPAGETIQLTASSSRGFFTGAVATAAGPAQSDGTLQIAHGDWIEARYLDEDPGGLRMASAWADFISPVITAVSVTNRFARTYVLFNTDERANAIVRFGTSPASLQSITNTFFEVEHAVALPPLTPSQTYVFEVASFDIAGNGATNRNGGALYSFVAPPLSTALLVDAATSSEFDNDIPLSVYTDALTQAGVTFDLWDPLVIGASPRTNDLAPYRAVIWRVSDGVGTADTLSIEQQVTVRDYLQGGGAFFMASMEQLTRIGNNSFRRDVLHVQDFSEDVTIPEILGIPNQSVTFGMEALLGYSHHNSFWHELLGVPDDISDAMVPGPEAEAILFDAFGEAAGIKYPRVGGSGNGRVIFFSFPLDAVPDTLRGTLMKNVLGFLVPGLNGNGTVAINSAAYACPASVVIELADSDLAGQSSATVHFATGSQPGGITVTLESTKTPGLFRGSADLIATTNTPVGGQIRAAGGDQITVSYFDASRNQSVNVEAVVDVVAPSITDVSAAAEFESAVISWRTDELSDSTVLFGESDRLSRTAQDSYLTTAHEVTLTQLAPDRTYYYKVVSRDPAGNVTEQDNAGQLHTFRTPKPILPPWSDNLDTPGSLTNWTFYTTDESQSQWTLGPPNNSLGANNAPSAPNAWGCNLNGALIDYAETMLISPAFLLTNGNSAKLTFQEAFDFTERSEWDIIEAAQVLAVFPSTGNYVVLRGDEEYSGWSQDWAPAEIDLTPHLGKIVYFVWVYQLLSWEGANRPGWLIDDIAVSVETVVPGVVSVSNNLWQASYTLSGRVFRRGAGPSEQITNAPPGTYTIVYNPIPNYQTPPSQTNVLSAGGTIHFSGEYVYIDQNKNGIADTWETNFFGNVTTNLSAQTDSDGDGLSDWMEFVAGTDPLSPPKPFPLTSAISQDGLAHFSWPTRAGKFYRLLYTTNLTTWLPYTDWLKASSNSATFDLPLSYGATRTFFRAEVDTQLQPGDPPPDLSLNRKTQADGSVLLSWYSAVGRAYQVEAGQDGQSWAAVSDWMRAAGSTMSYVVPAGQTAPHYRLSVSP